MVGILEFTQNSEIFYIAVLIRKFQKGKRDIAIMKPLNFTPAYKDYIWGGMKLKNEYGKKTDISPVAESWELSCHKDGLSIIDGGEFNGQTLASVIEKNPDVLGRYCNGNELPMGDLIFRQE